MLQSVSLSAFLAAQHLPLADARSPGEHAQGHLPGAHSLPLLDDEQRAAVGTTFKQRGQQAAVRQGFALAGPHFASMVDAGLALAGTGQALRLYCWRGGLRSNTLGWVLHTAGLQVLLLQGGYKAWRQLVLHSLAQPRRLLVLGGPTGTGKTELLQQLQAMGWPVLQLEGLAQHRGSSFGSIGMPPQPSQEQWENLLADALLQAPEGLPLLVEDESRMIGRLKLPDPLFDAMQVAPALLLDAPLPQRVQHIVGQYGCMPQPQLLEATQRLQRRLGGLRTQQAVQALQAGRLEDWAELLLQYYDKAYAYGQALRTGPSHSLPAPTGQLHGAAAVHAALCHLAQQQGWPCPAMQ